MTHTETATVHAARGVLLALAAAILLALVGAAVVGCRYQILSGKAGAACQLSGLIDPWEYKAAFPEIFGD